MYCKQCRYPLSHLRTPACPECGRAFDSSDRRTYSHTDRQWRMGVKTWLILLLAIYIGGYGAARWRKLLVHHERYTLRNGGYVNTVRAGTDLREHGVGAFKNAIAGPVAFIFAPLRSLEAAYWNWRSDDGVRQVIRKVPISLREIEGAQRIDDLPRDRRPRSKSSARPTTGLAGG